MQSAQDHSTAELGAQQGDVEAAPVVLMFAGGQLGWCLANHIRSRFDNLVVIQEQPESKINVVQRRARLLGWRTALGQAAFGVATRLLEPLAARQRLDIIRDSGLDPRHRRALQCFQVPSVNSEACRMLLKQLNPAVIAVYGTRLIKPETLTATDAPFINYHAGITPAYRGQQPAYWALSKGDNENAGVTIHLVDTGVDTGGILYQKVVSFASKDSVLTYQWRQLVEALPLLEMAIKDALKGKLRARHVELPSTIFYPPTLWRYVWNGLSKSIW